MELVFAQLSCKVVSCTLPSGMGGTIAVKLIVHPVPAKTVEHPVAVKLILSEGTMVHPVASKVPEFVTGIEYRVVTPIVPKS